MQDANPNRIWPICTNIAEKAFAIYNNVLPRLELWRKFIPKKFEDQQYLNENIIMWSYNLYSTGNNVVFIYVMLSETNSDKIY